MEHLTKQQIILLALLVSFVSSIAAAVSVVSLMQQDQSVPVTQTINNVIERTIERASGNNTTTPSTITKETVIVRQDDAVTSAIEKSSKAIVRIFWSGSGPAESFAGLGIIASSSGKIIAKTDLQYGGTYTAHLDGGNIVPMSFVSYDPASGLSTFQAEQSINPDDARTYDAISFADSDAAKIGQSVILMMNAEEPTVSTGIISSFSKDHKTIRTNIKNSDFNDQALIINLSGELLGVRDQDKFDTGFIPSNIIETYATP